MRMPFRRPSLAPLTLAMVSLWMGGCATTPPAPAPSAREVTAEAPAEATTEATTSEQAAAPKVFTAVMDGSPAPEFDLETLAGDRRITVKSLSGKPTVLLFGSATCPPFVESLDQLNTLYLEYQDRVNFVLVYIREAHPTDGPADPKNRFKIATPRTMEERKDAAKQLRRVTRVQIPIALDGMDDAMIDAYRPWPSRIVVLDPRGVAVDALPAGPRATLNGALRLRSIIAQVLRNG